MKRMLILDCGIKIKNPKSKMYHWILDVFYPVSRNQYPVSYCESQLVFIIANFDVRKVVTGNNLWEM